jgi:hypothetical protein
MAAVVQHRPIGGIGNSHNLNDTLNDILNGKINYPIEDATMDVWDKGVFLNELRVRLLWPPFREAGIALQGI